MSEEVEVKTDIYSYKTKFNFKDNNIRALVDLKMHLYRFDQDMMRNLWINPYFEVNVARNLSNPVYSLGFLVHKDMRMMENVC